MSEYKLVPVEPTVEMLEAGKHALEAGCYASGIYADMLADAPAEQLEPVGWQFYQHGKWWNGDDRIKDHKKNTEEAGFRVRDVYAAPQPAPGVARLGEALEELIDLMEDTRQGEHTPDSFTTQPARIALAAYRKGDE